MATVTMREKKIVMVDVRSHVDTSGHAQSHKTYWNPHSLRWRLLSTVMKEGLSLAIWPISAED